MPHLPKIQKKIFKKVQKFNIKLLYKLSNFSNFFLRMKLSFFIHSIAYFMKWAIKQIMDKFQVAYM